MAEVRYESITKDLEMARKLQELEGDRIVHFVIDRLGPSQVPARTTSEACLLVIPTWFVQVYKDQLEEALVREEIHLESSDNAIPWSVSLKRYDAQANSKSPHVYKFGRGWRRFANGNGLLEGDGLIFEGVRGWSKNETLEKDSSNGGNVLAQKFRVHVFRGNGIQTTKPSVHTPAKYSLDSQLSHENHGQHDSSGACSSHQHLSVQAGDLHNICNAVTAKKRQAREEGSPSASQCTTPRNKCIKLYLPDLANAQVLSQSSPQGISVNQQPTLVHQLPKVSLPSFIQKLVEYNVQDSAGNTSGARFDVPIPFLKAHNIHLHAHVKLQGTHEGSPFRFVTCSHCLKQESECLDNNVLVSLGWGDFVRDNALRAGQELVFTLVSESFFAIKEVAEIVIYTK